MKYIIYALNYSEKSAGIKTLHLLCHYMRTVGYEAYVLCDYISPDLNTPRISPFEAVVAIAEGATIIYPETVSGNPLEALHVIRYVLNIPGHLGGDKTYKESEYVISYDTLIAPDNTKDILYMPTIDLSLFTLLDVPRSGSTLYIGKGRMKGGIVPANATHITRTYPTTKHDLVVLFQTSEVFYTFDNLTALMYESVLCGCPAVLIPNGLFTREQYEKSVLGLDGIAWGVDELQRAKNTTHLLRNKYELLYGSIENKVSTVIQNYEKSL